jgi:hypothetical protein
MPVAADAERPLQDAWQTVTERADKRALKHGRYSAEAIARRREVATLVRDMRALAGKS